MATPPGSAVAHGSMQIIVEVRRNGFFVSNHGSVLFGTCAWVRRVVSSPGGLGCRCFSQGFLRYLKWPLGKCDSSLASNNSKMRSCSWGVSLSIRAACASMGMLSKSMMNFDGRLSSLNELISMPSFCSPGWRCGRFMLTLPVARFVSGKYRSVSEFFQAYAKECSRWLSITQAPNARHGQGRMVGCVCWRM